MRDETVPQFDREEVLVHFFFHDANVTDGVPAGSRPGGNIVERWTG